MPVRRELLQLGGATVCRSNYDLPLNMSMRPYTPVAEQYHYDVCPCGGVVRVVTSPQPQLQCVAPCMEMASCVRILQKAQESIAAIRDTVGQMQDDMYDYAAKVEVWLSSG